jgi:hypothetical protein
LQFMLQFDFYKNCPIFPVSANPSMEKMSINEVHRKFRHMNYAAI